MSVKGFQLSHRIGWQQDLNESEATLEKPC